MSLDTVTEQREKKKQNKNFIGKINKQTYYYHEVVWKHINSIFNTPTKIEFEYISPV